MVRTKVFIEKLPNGGITLKSDNDDLASVLLAITNEALCSFVNLTLPKQDIKLPVDFDFETVDFYFDGEPYEVDMEYIKKQIDALRGE